MKFTYRFNSILKIKEKIEEEKKYALASQQRTCDMEKENLNRLLEKKNAITSKKNQLTRNNNIVKIRELKNASQDIQFINDLIDNQTIRVEQQEKRVVGCREELIVAKKQKKIYEKIMEKDYQNFKQQEFKKEAAFIDQLVTYKSTVRGG
ncbi:flagellar export protein FliJ [Natronincola ferrireducens]|uniref:Flagellar FliJ protein n=1 Tax=Natronincola ferrireducens TaxID=393762 RepID=A0A1G9C126_9FIRM|nr:flagellar export protein FliJ [Natronincola ferrireducens]SDK45313.1 flagellar FliJ protein [Natronincola ferrireducens]